MSQITLTPLAADDREQFILDNQEAFRYGAMKEFGLRDDHFEEDGEIISRATIEKSIDGGVAYRIREDGKIVGGLVLKIDEKTQINELELLFITPGSHSRGIGTAAWQAAEHLYPDTRSRILLLLSGGIGRSRLRARSRVGSDSPPDCHSLPSRRYTLDSGSGGGNFAEVQVLLPAPQRNGYFDRITVSFLPQNGLK